MSVSSIGASAPQHYWTPPSQAAKTDRAVTAPAPAQANAAPYWKAKPEPSPAKASAHKVDVNA